MMKGEMVIIRGLSGRRCAGAILSQSPFRHPARGRVDNRRPSFTPEEYEKLFNRRWCTDQISTVSAYVAAIKDRTPEIRSLQGSDGDIQVTNPIKD
jgi:hypothetical protein